MFSNLVTEMFSNFTGTMRGMAAGFQTAFDKLIYANATEGTFSDIVIFLFVVLGIGLGTGVLFGIFKLIQGLAHRHG